MNETKAIDDGDYVTTGFFAGPIRKVTMIARELGLPDRRVVRSGRSYQVQVFAADRIERSRFDDAKKLWESLD